MFQFHFLLFFVFLVSFVSILDIRFVSCCSGFVVCILWSAFLSCCFVLNLVFFVFFIPLIKRPPKNRTLQKPQNAEKRTKKIS